MTLGRGKDDSLGGSGGKEGAKERAEKLLMVKVGFFLMGFDISLTTCWR